ncbi:MAG TPA: HAD hydrolase-like protein [Jatrophihabitantaceae bacterium]|nr:HAD hydrolase-like protein [Jatrophihabitantaceae bacterium]
MRSDLPGRTPRYPTRPGVVLFDLDGTLSDSAPGILASLRHAFTTNGLPPLSPEIERAILGPPFYESLPPLIEDVPLADVISAYREHYGSIGMFDTAPYAGVRMLLETLTGSGAVVAVATSKPEHYAVPIVEFLGLADLVATVGGDELDGSLPTKALVIDKVLARLGRPPASELVMVGDRSHDVVGAREHGIASFGAAWGYALPGELEAAGPELICATPGDVARALAVDGSGAAAS